MNFKTIYCDKDFVILEKPQGVPVQPDKTGDADLLSSIENGFIINRLDRPVGGTVLIAKNKLAASELSKKLQTGFIKKVYYAVVCGCPEAKKGRLKDYIVKNEKLNMSFISKPSEIKAKEAILDYDVVRTVNNNEYGLLSLIKINLLTGRHHQIRVQLLNASCPIWGDSKYNENFKRLKFFPALWAYEMSFDYNRKHITAKSIPSITPFDIFEL